MASTTYSTPNFDEDLANASKAVEEAETKLSHHITLRPASAEDMNKMVAYLTNQGLLKVGLDLGLDIDIPTVSFRGDADLAIAKSAAIRNIQKALTARGDGDAAVAKTAAIKNIQKALTGRILKGDEVKSSGCNVHYEINFNNGSSGSSGAEERRNIQKALTARILKRFATGMNGDEDLGQDITMKGQKFHYRFADSDGVLSSLMDSNVTHGSLLKNLVTDKPSPIMTMVSKASERGAYIPASREDYDNAKELWKGDFAKYRAAHPHDQDCSISESDNWLGAQQCSQSWECRGARLCERGGWCSGYDGCEGTPLPTQAPGLSPDN